MKIPLPVLLASLGLLLPPAWSADVRRTTATRLVGTVRIDGSLDDEVWRNSETIGEFIQAEPYPNTPPTERTDMRIAYDKDALYLAVRCFDRAPATVFTTTMTRDAKFYFDDGLEIVFDTFRDRRNAYYFATNAVGAMTDGRIIENSSADMSWDGIWEVKTTIDDQGWSAEFRIPFKTLSFNPNSDTWGFNIERFLARANEDQRWTAIRPDAEIHAISLAGDLAGLEGLSQGIGLDIKPYGLIGVNRDSARVDQVQAVRDAGADVFYRITSNLLSSTTINTDFAETEVDTRQLNLTRFPTLFPEKRDFFLEDAGVFQFGIPNNASALMPFFSRKIGLVGGETTPILFGEKLTGNLGRLQLGFLDVMTRDSDVAPRQNFLSARAKLGFWKQSYIGGIITDGEPTGQSDNRLAGADVKLATSNIFGTGENFDLSMFGLKTSTPGLQSRNFAYGAQVRYPNDLVNLGYSWQDIGENFDPQLGYVRRRGVRVSSFSGRLGPRPNQWHIRQLTMSLSIDNYYNTSQRAVESRSYGFTPLGLNFHGSERFQYSLTHSFERLFEPFEINKRKAIRIPEGGYSFLQHSISYSGPSNKALSYSLGYQKGSFYTGSTDQFTGALTWRKSARLSTGLEFRQYWVRLKEGDFDTSLTLFRFDYSFSPRLTLRNFVQYDNDTRNVGLQSRLNWIIRPGSEVYVVFNHEWRENALDRFEALRTDARAKLNYTFRF